MTTVAPIRPAGLPAGIDYDEVDGIPTLLAPGTSPAITAGLLFRVGWADETYTTSGITHLVEHLALHGQRLGDGHLNGVTTEQWTIFHITGEEHEVVAFLNDVCAGLRELPVDRMETEKGILRAEMGGRPPIGGGRSLRRFGFQGRGLLVAMEAGLDALTAEQLQGWADDRFTTGNAVLWMTVPTVPEGLDLRLAAGPRRALPSSEDVRRHRPSWFASQAPGVVAEALVPRNGGAAGVFGAIAGNRLLSELREQRGASYSAGCVVEPVDHAVVKVVLAADAVEGRDDEVAHGILDVVEAMSDPSSITEEEILRVRREAERALSSAEPLDLLPDVAQRLLLGEELLDAAQRLERFLAVTADDIAAVARAVLGDANVQVPVAPFERPGFASLEAPDATPVAGVRFRSADHADLSVMIGLDGVSWIWAEGCVTVRFDEVVAVLAWPDGARWFMSRDGSEFSIEPTLFHRLRASTVADLDRHIDPALIIHRPERPRAEIPRPARGRRQLPAEAKPTKPMRWKGLGKWAVAPGLVLLMLTPVFGVLSYGDSLAMGRGETQLWEVLLGWGITAVAAAATVLLIAGVVRRRRWDREHGPI